MPSTRRRTASAATAATLSLVALAGLAAVAGGDPAPDRDAVAESHAALARERPRPFRGDDGLIHAEGRQFESWREYHLWQRARGVATRCGFVRGLVDVAAGGEPGDCTYTLTNPADVYDPGVRTYRVNVVFHVIRNASGLLGNVSLERVQEQIAVLNEDFRALPGTNGENGTDIAIEFVLADVDPDGNPTNGVTFSNNTSWYNDNGAYWNTLAWDTDRYLNIYSNSAGGALGYVPDLPQGGIAGSPEDRVVVLHETVGQNAPIGPPFHLGRTLTHEVGHYFGLEHTFWGGCGSITACYTTGDLICDTNRQSQPTFGCGGASCGSPNPFDNYMDYSDDDCMERFTPEQARRIRCSLEHYRPLLAEIVDEGPCLGDLDGSRAIDFEDVLILVSNFGPCLGCPGDLDGDGAIDFDDILTVLSLWGDC